jgi:hypothetical protein
MPRMQNSTEKRHKGMKQETRFEAKIYSKGRIGFNFPLLRAKELGYKHGEPFSVDLAITNPNKKYFDVPFTSGTEIRIPRVFVGRALGDEIRVIANRSKLPTA